MPPSSMESSVLDEAASAVVVLEQDDTAGWDALRKKLLSQSENVPALIGECLRAAAEPLVDYGSQSSSERSVIVKEVQRIIQAGAETLWQESNVQKTPSSSFLPKHKNEEAPPSGPPSPLPPPPRPQEILPTVQRSSSEEEILPKAKLHGGKFLTFALAEEEFGIEILKVQEIISHLPITPVPRTPNHLKGVINLRGKIIPVVDLRLKLGLRAQEGQSCIIICRAQNLEVGISVDSVNEVADIPEKDIEPAPSYGAGIAGEELWGMAKMDERVLLLLDVDRTLAPEHLRNGSGGPPSAATDAARP